MYDALPLYVSLRTQEDVVWGSVWTGSVLRGITSSALSHSACACAAPRGAHESFCPAAAILQGPEGAGDHPYALIPDRAEAREAAFWLVLYANAIGYAETCTSALGALQTHGIGTNRARVERVSVHAWSGESLLDEDGSVYAPPEALDLAEGGSTTEAGYFHIQSRTPLSLGQGRSGPPTLDALWNATQRRCRLLWPETPLPPWLESMPEGTDAGGITLPEVSLRYSVRQRRRHPLRGVTGTWDYHAPKIPLIAWARMLRWLPIGGRTAFGHGHLRIGRGDRSIG